MQRHGDVTGRCHQPAPLSRRQLASAAAAAALLDVHGHRAGGCSAGIHAHQAARPLIHLRLVRHEQEAGASGSAAAAAAPAALLLLARDVLGDASGGGLRQPGRGGRARVGRGASTREGAAPPARCRSNSRHGQHVQRSACIGIQYSMPLNMDLTVSSEASTSSMKKKGAGNAACSARHSARLASACCPPLSAANGRQRCASGRTCSVTPSANAASRSSV